LFALQISGLIYLITLLTTGQIPWLAIAFFLRVGPMYGRQFFDAISTGIVPPSQHGLAFGVSATVQRTANVLASLTAGWLYSFKPSLPFQISLIFIFITLVITVLSISHVTSEQKLNVIIPEDPKAPYSY